MTSKQNILSTIAESTRTRIEEQKLIRPTYELKARAEELAAEELKHYGTFHFPFEEALAAPGMSFICELKQASPSKGQICENYDYLRFACEYEEAGAAAISCLTEPQWFKGSLEHLKEIAQQVSIPVLRKDFIVDEYMIYEAKLAGAQAILLIVSICKDDELARFVSLAHALGMSCLVEAYASDEVSRALHAGARIVGVNNRDLRDFGVNFGHSIELREQVGKDRIFVSESGVTTADDIALLAQAQVDAVLIGEALMRATDKRAALAALKEKL